METSTIITTTREQVANNIHRIMRRMIYPISMQCLHKGHELHSTSICDQDQPSNPTYPSLVYPNRVCLSPALLVFPRCRERNPNRTYENPRRRSSRWLRICRLFLLVVSRLTTVKLQTTACRTTLHLLDQAFQQAQHLLTHHNQGQALDIQHRYDQA